MSTKIFFIFYRSEPLERRILEMEAEVSKSKEELESALGDAKQNLELELSKTTSLEKVRLT